MIWAIINLAMTVWMVGLTISSVVDGDFVWAAIFLAAAAFNFWAFLINEEVRGAKR